jgi:hypothetical protein
MMRSPSIIPVFDIDVYLVLDDFGKLGRAYRETDEEASDRETVIRNLMSGEYTNPVRVVAFNTAKGWTRDVTEDTAWAVIDEAQRSGTLLHGAAIDFVERATGKTVPPSLIDA